MKPNAVSVKNIKDSVSSLCFVDTFPNPVLQLHGNNALSDVKNASGTRSDDYKNIEKEKRNYDSMEWGVEKDETRTETEIRK